MASTTVSKSAAVRAVSRGMPGMGDHAEIFGATASLRSPCGAVHGLRRVCGILPGTGSVGPICSISRLKEEARRHSSWGQRMKP